MSDTACDLRWWRQEEPHQAVTRVVDRMRARQDWRRTLLLRAYCLYDDYPANDAGPAGYAVRRIVSDKRLSFNVIRSCADTVRSEVIQSRPRPMFLTQGGNYEEQKRGKQMGKFLEGLFNEQRFDRLASLVALDAIVCGAGILRPYAQDGRVHLERILPHELWVDDRDAYYGAPRSAYLTRWVDRDVLLELYPDQADRIRVAKSASNDIDWEGEDSEADLVLVTEAWHLASSKKADDGRHVIAIDGCTLLAETFEDDAFPFIVLRWKDAQQGFWPKGLADELTGIQRSLNRCSDDIEDGQELHAHAKIAVERSSHLNEKKFKAGSGLFVEFDRTPPQALIIPSVSAEVYQREEALINRAYQMSGVAASAARSEKPAGLESGIALRLHADLQSRRFLDFQQAFQQFYMDVAEQVVALLRRVSKEHPDYEVVYRGRYHVERIAWGEVSLEEGSYQLQLQPVSLLPSTPEGKLQTLQTLLDSKLSDAWGVPAEAFAGLLDFPDLQSLLGFVSSGWDLIAQTLERLLDEGEDGYTPPEPFDNLAMCLLVGVHHYQQWRLWRVPEDRLDLLRQWLSEVQALLAKAQAPTPQAPPADAAPPGAALPPDPTAAAVPAPPAPAMAPAA